MITLHSMKNLSLLSLMALGPALALGQVKSEAYEQQNSCDRDLEQELLHDGTIKARVPSRCFFQALRPKLEWYLRSDNKDYRHRYTWHPCLSHDFDFLLGFYIYNAIKGSEQHEIMAIEAKPSESQAESDSLEIQVGVSVDIGYRTGVVTRPKKIRAKSPGYIRLKPVISDWQLQVENEQIDFDFSGKMVWQSSKGGLTEVPKFVHYCWTEASNSKQGMPSMNHKRNSHLNQRVDPIVKTLTRAAYDEIDPNDFLPQELIKLRPRYSLEGHLRGEYLELLLRPRTGKDSGESID